MSSISLARPAVRQKPSLRARVVTWLARRRSRAALARLDDHLLADIGIDRAHADYEASRTIWHD